MYYAIISESTSWRVLYTPKDDTRGRKQFPKCAKVAGSDIFGDTFTPEWMSTELLTLYEDRTILLCSFVNVKLPDRVPKG